MAARRSILPTFAKITSVQDTVRRVDWTVHDAETILTFDQRWSYVQPWVLAALAAWGQDQKEAGGSVAIENADRASYAWRFGLHDFLGVSPDVLPTEHEEAGRFMALRSVRNQVELTGLLADIVPMLHLGETPERAKAVQYAMSEMVRNTLEHSGSAKGAVVCAQLYPGSTPKSRRYLSIGIADTGKGVRASLAANYPEIASDRAAVLKAIQPGVTGTSSGMYGSSNNAGAGLFITRRLCAAGWGYFGVYSGDAFFVTSIAEKRPKDEDLVRDVKPFRGTVVCVELNISRDADFAAMLASARAAFTQGDTARRGEVERRVQFR